MNQCVDILLSNADIIPYSAHYVYGTAKTKPTGERFYTRFTFLETRQIRRVTCRRGETPHLLESSLIAICDRASNGKQHNKLRRFTKRLRYRCGRCFANFNHPFPMREGCACRGRHSDTAGSAFPDRSISSVAFQCVVAAAEHLKVFGNGLAALRPRHNVVDLSLNKFAYSYLVQFDLHGSSTGLGLR